jgi:hypothetical protein
MAKHLRRTPAALRAGRAVTVPLVLAGAMALTAPAFAGKPAPSGTSGGSGSSLSLVVKSGTDSVANHAETVTFNVQSSTYKKWVDLFCYQNGQQVFSQSAGFFPEYPWTTDYVLSSSNWTSGAADCSAKLYTVNSRGRQSTLATLSFHVSA